MVMRKHLVEGAYEKLKKLTRGKGGITKAKMQKFVDALDIPATDKKRLKELTPISYVGLAERLVEEYELGISSGKQGCGSGGGCGGCGGCG